MTERFDVMVDLETLGVDDDAPIFQVAAVAFDIATGDVYKKFNGIINLEDQVVAVDGNTLKWWLNTDAELLNRLINSDYAIPEFEIVDYLWEWLIDLDNGSYRNTHMWANGISFDIVKLKKMFDRHGMTLPIRYSNERDVRTIIDLAATLSGQTDLEFKKEHQIDNVKHDALDDCMSQVQQVSRAYNILLKGGCNN